MKEKIDYSIENLELIEPLVDTENYLAEVSLALGNDPNEVVMAYAKQRGLIHSDDGDIVFAKSFDGGKTWDQSTVVTCMKMHDLWGFTSASLKVLKNGTILVLAHTNYLSGPKSNTPFGVKGAYITRSSDGGKTWSLPETFDVHPLRRINIWDNPIELDDGTLLLAVSGTLFDPNCRGSINESVRCCLACSDDGGLTWYCRGTIAYDSASLFSFHEPGMTIAPDGRMIACMRQHYEFCRGNLPGGYMYTAESNDGGYTWSPFKNTGIWGYPIDPVVLKNGYVLAAYGYRRDPLGIRIAISRDGSEFSKENVGVIHSPPLVESQGSIKTDIDIGYRHIGYPSSVVRDDGKVLTAFHSFNKERRQVLRIAMYDISIVESGGHA